jgi:hypothetical protein
VSYVIIVACVVEGFQCSLMLAVSARAEMLTRTAHKALNVPNNKYRLGKAFRQWLQNHQRYLE